MPFMKNLSLTILVSFFVVTTPVNAQVAVGGTAPTSTVGKLERIKREHDQRFCSMTSNEEFFAFQEYDENEGETKYYFQRFSSMNPTEAVITTVSSYPSIGFSDIEGDYMVFSANISFAEADILLFNYKTGGDAVAVNINNNGSSVIGKNQAPLVCHGNVVWNRENDDKLYAYKIATGDISVISPDNIEASDPEECHNGRLLYTGRVDGNPKSDVLIYDFNTGQTTHIATPAVASAHEGAFAGQDLIVYGATDSSGPGLDHDVYTYNLETGETEDLATDDDFRYSGVAANNKHIFYMKRILHDGPPRSEFFIHDIRRNISYVLAYRGALLDIKERKGCAIMDIKGDTDVFLYRR